MATLEGADVMIPGNGVVLIGMSERSSRQAITQVAAALFARGGAEQVIVAGMPKLRAAMHLDTIFTFADRDCVTIYPDIVRQHQHLHPSAERHRTRGRRHPRDSPVPGSGAHRSWSRCVAHHRHRRQCLRHRTPTMG